SNLKLNETICLLFVKWNIIYLWTRYNELSNTDLIAFENCRQEILYTLIQQKKITQFENLNFIIDKNPWYSLQLYNADYIISQLKSDKLIPQETIQGFKYLQNCIEDFLSDIEKNLLNSDIQIEVFKNAKLKSKIIIRASPSYYKASYYSNVAIKIDNDEQ
ncbi:23296_t:CDS:2, partial [Dentiscutata erythropus]